MRNVCYLTTLAAVTLATSVHAGDVYKLGLPASATPTVTLGGTDADVVDVAHRGGGGHRGGSYHGYHGGGYRGAYHGYYRGYTGYRPYHYGYRGYYGRGWYPRVYVGLGGYLRYYDYDYYTAPYAYYSTPYSSSIEIVAPARSLRVAPSTVIAPAQPTQSFYADEAEPIPAPRLAPLQPRTFDYDGGPRVPAPMPKAEPIQAPKPTAQPNGRFVSLPTPAPKLTYPAYGETLQASSKAKDAKSATYLIQANVPNGIR